MTSALYLLTAIAVGIVAEIGCAFWYLRRKLAWLHDVLIPWINALDDKLGLPK